MNSTQRVAKYRESQERAGRKLVQVYLSLAVIDQMKQRTKPHTYSELLESALTDYLKAHA